MTRRIDISRLARPEIPGLLLTLEDAHAAHLDYLETEYGWAVTRSAADPAWRITRLIAAREVMVRQAVSDAMAQTTLAYATDAALDHIGLTYYLLPRLAGEPDDRYRHRLADSMGLYAVGLSGPWYEATARAVAGVSDARVLTTAPGAVTIYILADDKIEDDAGDALYPDGIPTTALLTAVEDRVTAEEARQQTDVVTVSPCTRARFDVTVTVNALSEPDLETVLAASRANLAALARQVSRLGVGISTTLIAGACVDPSGVLGATISLASVDGAGVATQTAAIAGVVGVALQARTLTVTSA